MARFWAFIGGTIQGPFEFRELTKQPGFTMKTSICREGEDTWGPACTLFEIKAQSAPSAKPAPAAPVRPALPPVSPKPVQPAAPLPEHQPALAADEDADRFCVSFLETLSSAPEAAPSVAVPSSESWSQYEEIPAPAGAAPVQAVIDIGSRLSGPIQRVQRHVRFCRRSYLISFLSLLSMVYIGDWMTPALGYYLAPLEIHAMIPRPHRAVRRPGLQPAHPARGRAVSTGKRQTSQQESKKKRKDQRPGARSSGTFTLAQGSPL